MRILHALHDYLAEHIAGVEVYTKRVAQLQARRSGDSVAVLFARLDAAKRTGHLLELGVDPATSARHFAVIQNRDWTAFEQTWRDERLIPAFETALDRFEPDILHVEHLLNLGLPLVECAKRRGIPSVMTLHDQWFACAAGGQRFRRERLRCDDLVVDRCGRCASPQVGPALAARGWRQRRAHTLSAAAAPMAAISPSGQAQPQTIADGDGLRRRISRRAAGWAEGFARAIWQRAAAPQAARQIERRWNDMRALGDEIDLFVAPSDFIRDAAVDFGFPSRKIIRLPHGFVTAEGERRKRILPDRLLRFGYVGSIVPHKGLHHLVEAFDGLPEEATLDLVGSLDDHPTYVEELKRSARHPGIRFLGQRAPEVIPDFLETIDCLVAPSIWAENAPLCIQEAFLVGRPVVASRLGGHPQLLASGGGLLYEADDPVALRKALSRLISEPGLGRSQAARIPSVLPIDAHVASLRGLYERALDGSRVVFLDRDGVINRESDEFIKNASEWHPIEGSLDAIARLGRRGIRVVVVSNQSGLARGILSEDDLAEIHRALHDALRARGAWVDSIYYCPHGPDDGCSCRKPAPGLLFRARDELGVEIEGAPFVGDRPTDLEAARAAGCQPVLVGTGRTRAEDLGAEWDAVPRYASLASAVDAWLDRDEWPPVARIRRAQSREGVPE